MARKSLKGNTLSAELQEIKETKAKAKINLGDSASLKRALDDAAAEALTESGYVEDHTFSDIKIAVGIFTCVLALIAQFYPKKYPDNFWVLVACVGLYILASVTLNLVLGGIEGDAFCITKPKGRVTLCLASKLPRYSEEYTLMLGSKKGKWTKGLNGPQASLKKSITSYFDVEGVLAEELFKNDVESLLKQFERQQKKISNVENRIDEDGKKRGERSLVVQEVIKRPPLCIAPRADSASV